jgi:hypothetical protein
MARISAASSCSGSARLLASLATGSQQAERIGQFDVEVL